MQFALGSREFVPYFQPVVDIRSAALTGFEILARWNHPTLGLLSPDSFITAAERDGWIGDLTTCLLEQAFADTAQLPTRPNLALNISALQLHNLELPRQIERIASATGFPLERLAIEVTESALARDDRRACHVANQLKEIGCRLALDDFGTGYSSLRNLQLLPFDVLKVDKSFVSSMTTSRESRKIVAAVVGLGQTLGITTVAEGIETAAQDEMLLWLGCDHGQGWLYGPPLPEESLAAAIAQPRARTTPPRAIEDLPTRRSVSRFDQLPATRLAQVQAVYDGAPVGLAFVDRELRYLTINRRLAETNGLPMEAHLGHTIPELLPDIYAIIEPYLRGALAGESFRNLLMKDLVIRDNPPRSFLLSYEPARDEAGEVVGISIAVLDLTTTRIV